MHRRREPASVASSTSRSLCCSLRMPLHLSFAGITSLARLVSRVLPRRELARHLRKVLFLRGKEHMLSAACMSVPTTGANYEVETPVGRWASCATCGCGREHVREHKGQGGLQRLERVPDLRHAPNSLSCSKGDREIYVRCARRRRNSRICMCATAPSKVRWVKTRDENGLPLVGGVGFLTSTVWTATAAPIL